MPRNEQAKAAMWLTRYDGGGEGEEERRVKEKNACLSVRISPFDLSSHYPTHPPILTPHSPKMTSTWAAGFAFNKVRNLKEKGRVNEGGRK